MAPADLLTGALILAALIGCINHLWIRLPPAIGMLIGSLTVSLLAVLMDRLLNLHLLSWLRGNLDAAGLSHLFLDGVLALLLFAGSLQVDISELKGRRWVILLLATVSVI